MVSTSLKQPAWCLSLLLAVVGVLGFGGAVSAQDEAAEPADTTTEAPAEAPADAPAKGVMGFATDEVPAELQKNFQEMVHFYRVARLDLAKDFADLVLAANPEPLQVLKLAESDKGLVSLIDQMCASDSPEFSASARRVMAVVKQGMYLKRKDGDRIIEQLIRLGKNQRAYELALRELKYSGEYVVPYALGLLADESHADLHDDIEMALIEIDRPVVYPLIVGLETEAESVRLTVIDVLSKLGYKMALPALKALVESGATSDAVKEAARKALVNIGGPEALTLSAKQAYFDLAEALYYDRLTVVADPKESMTDVWGWVKDSGLAYRPAPTRSVNEIMAAQAAQNGLRADPNAADLVALWLSIRAQLKVELQAAGGGKAPWDPPTMPTTEFFLRSAGQQYLFEVLGRAIRDENVMVALQAIRALEDVANETYLGAAIGQGSPLIRALSYPDRLIRFGAAFAIVAVEPKKPFLGDNRVVPVLAEAVNLETGPGILIIDADQNNLNRLQGEFRKVGWSVAAAGNGNEGISRGRGMARMDAVLLAVNVENVGYVDVIQLLRTDFNTAMVPIIVLSGEAEAVPFSHLKQNQKYIDQVPAAASMADVVEKIKVLQAEAGSVALSPKASEQISLRAARTLGFVATADLAFTADAARVSLLTAAAGKNEPLAVAAMGALVQMPDQEIQQRLAEIALAEGASQTIQVTALDAIAQMARHIGNQLQTASVTALLKRVGTETDDKIRDAIGRVLGALDLDPNMASGYVLEHATE